MKQSGLLVLIASLVAGCGTVGAIVTAPITAPIMFFSARMNDRDDFLDRARQNDRPLPPIDARSRGYAQVALEQALERATIDRGLYWQNNEDASGYAAGGVTVLESGHTDNGRACREVLIETAMARHTDQRVRTYCRDDNGWTAVVTPPGGGSS